MPFKIPDHPDIVWIERTGYPQWCQDEDDDEETEEQEG
jgi:hypothetical protein